jgi:uncharacterized protein (TIGR03663 family)
MPVISDRASAPATAGAPRGDVSRRGWWTAIIYIAAVALFLRFYDLSLKPLHHDEGVNTLFLTDLVRPPHAYTYDPGNYHGPTLFYFGWLSVSLFGMTTPGIRLVTAFAGLAAVLMLVLVKRQIGAAGALAAAAMLAASPGAVYYSRYFIHESLLVCFTLGSVVFSVLWWTRRRRVFLHLAAASAGIMFATKETAFISAVVLVAAAVGSAVLVELAMAPTTGERPRLGSRVSHAIAAQCRALAAAWRERGGILLLAQASVVFAAVALLFYTSFFTHWEGAIDSVRTFAIWTRTGTTAHTRPWHTYLAWLAAEELPLLVGGGIGAIAALWRPENRLATFAALWSVGTLAAYSMIPYKTPWLTLNVIVPLTLTAGYAFELLWRARDRASRVVLWAVVGAVLGVGTYRAAVLNFWRYDDERSPYVYAHTSREVLQLVTAIDQIEAQHPRTSIAVMSRDHFPLSWYLRDYAAGYYGRVVATKDPLVIASTDQQEELDAALDSRYERTGPYVLRPGVRLVLYVRRDLRRPPPSS